MLFCLKVLGKLLIVSVKNSMLSVLVTPDLMAQCSLKQ